VHKLFLTLATFLVAVAPNLQANDLNSSPVPVVYINVPFGGSAKTVPSYGLQLARVQQDRTGSVNLFQSIPYANLKFNGSELEAFNLNGVNTLQKVTTYNADGTTSTQSNINWKYVGWGALGFGALWWTCEERDRDLCGGDHDDEAPPLVEVSDIRLKRDITHITTLDNGLKLYSFKYLWEDTTYVGVMAQDLLEDESYRDAVVTKKSGFYAVKYNLLGLRMTTLEEWNRNPNTIYISYAKASYLVNMRSN